jgi:hypothetical protein
MANYYDMNVMEQFIRSEAIKRGIDPDQAMRVARSEGFRPDTWQSNVVGPSGREQSYGPFQLFMGGGLGNAFMKAYGEDPRNPSSAQDQVRFALDYAKRAGWSPWHGWKGDPWAGITTPATGDVAAGDVGGMARGAKMTAQQGADTTQNAVAAASTPPIVAAQLTGANKSKSLGGLLGQLASSTGKVGQAELLPPAQYKPMGGGGGSDALAKFLQQYMTAQMQKPPDLSGGTGLG